MAAMFRMLDGSRHVGWRPCWMVAMLDGGWMVGTMKYFARKERNCIVPAIQHGCRAKPPVNNRNLMCSTKLVNCITRK